MRTVNRKKDDWRNWKNGWKYKKDAPKDEQWQKDRAKCFRKNGNGWWINPEKREYSTRPKWQI